MMSCKKTYQQTIDIFWTKLLWALLAIGFVIAIPQVAFATAPIADVSVSHELANPDLACQQPIEPTVLRTEYGPTNKVLNKNPIYYLEGSYVDLSLLLKDCTTVSNVYIEISGKTEELGTAATIRDQVEGTINIPFHYEKLPTIPQKPAGRHLQPLRIHFPDYDDGTSIDVTVRVTSISGTLASTYAFTVVMAKEVNDGIWNIHDDTESKAEKVHAQPVLTISEATIVNDAIASLYKKFGDNGRIGNGVGEMGTFELYDPSYKSLVTLKDGYAQLNMQFKAHIPYYCDPKISVKGKFTIELDEFDSVQIKWINGPTVDIGATLACQIPITLAQAITGVGSMYAIQAEDRVRDLVRDAVEKTVPRGIEEAGARRLDPIDKIEIRHGRVDVYLNVIAGGMEAVTLEMPYNTSKLGNGWNGGVAVRKSDKILLLASNLPRVCALLTNPAACKAYEVDQTGLFNWDVARDYANTSLIETNNAYVPVLSPWVTGQGVVAYHKERHKAWKELRGLRRDVGKLPMGTEKVGGVISQFTNRDGSFLSKTHVNNYGCYVNAATDAQDVDSLVTYGGDSTRLRLIVAANDQRYQSTKEMGIGNRRITMIWLPDLFISKFAPCHQ